MREPVDSMLQFIVSLCWYHMKQKEFMRKITPENIRIWRFVRWDRNIPEE